MANMLSGIAPTLRIAIMGLMMAVLVIGAVYVTSNREREAADVAVESGEGTDIPAIDASAPTDVEVATFALG